MALAYVSAGTATAGTTTATAGTPASTVSGDTILLFAVTKLSSATVSTPAGWTLEFQNTAGTTPDGAGTGLVKLSCFSLVRGASLTIPAVTTSGTGAAIIAQALAYRTDAGTILDVTELYRNINFSTSSFGTTTTTQLDFLTNDLTLLFAGATAVATFTQTTWTISGTGNTIGVPTELRDTSTTNGNDLSLYLAQATVTAGVGNIGNVTPGSTSSPSTSGGSYFMRLRQVSLATDVTPTEATLTVAANNAPAQIGGFSNVAAMPSFNAADPVPTGTANASATVATLTADGNNAPITINPQANVSAIVGLDAQNAGPAIAPTTGVAAVVSFDAQNAVPTGTANATPSDAALGVAAADAVSVVNTMAPATVAALSVDSNDGSPAISSPAVEATLSVAAENATLSLSQPGPATDASLSVSAENPGVSGTAGTTSADYGVDGFNPGVSASVGASAATLSVDSGTATPTGSANATPTDATLGVQAADTTVTRTSSPNPTEAALGVDALTTSTSVGPESTTATLTVDAQSVVPTGTASATPTDASLSVAAQNIGFQNSESVQTGSAAFGVDGANSTPAVGASAGNAALSVDANQSAGLVGVNATSADLSVDATLAGDRAVVPIHALYSVDAGNPGGNVRTDGAEATFSMAAGDPLATGEGNAFSTEATLGLPGVDPDVDTSGNTAAPSAVADLGVAAQDAVGLEELFVVPDTADFSVEPEDCGILASSPSDAAAELATFGVASQNTGVSVSTEPEVAEFEIEGDVFTSVSASADVGTLTVAAQSATVAFIETGRPNEAAFTVSAVDPTINSVSRTFVNATEATFVTAAENPTPNPAVSASAATLAVQAQNTTGTVGSGATEATLGVAGADAVVGSASQTTVSAGAAQFAMDAANTTFTATTNAAAGVGTFELDAIDVLANAIYNVLTDAAEFGIQALSADIANTNGIIAGVADYGVVAANIGAAIEVPAAEAEFTTDAHDLTVGFTFYAFAAEATIGVAGLTAGTAGSTTPESAVLGISAQEADPTIPPKSVRVSPYQKDGPTVSNRPLVGASVSGYASKKAVIISTTEG